VDDADLLKDYLAGSAAHANRDHHPPPDLLILDGVMPHGSAKDVLLWLKEHPVAGMKTVVLNGSSLPETCEEPLQLGAHDCYHKSGNIHILEHIAKEIETHMPNGDYDRQMAVR
jgi:DNA-binding NarL/FixJ family response regulator